MDLGQPLIDNGDENGGVGIPVYGEDEQGAQDRRDRRVQQRLQCDHAHRVFLQIHGGWVTSLPLDITQDLPGDLAETTTSDGLTVDYIIRVERGTVNRFIYAIAMLASPDELKDTSWDLTAWNGKLVYQFEEAWPSATSRSGTVRDLYDDVLF